jgi:hypothetical protein
MLAPARRSGHQVRNFYAPYTACTIAILPAAFASAIMTDPSPSPPQDDDTPHGRWPFIRDVLVLQLKLLIGNLHNFILIPATTIAAAVDLIFKSGRHGSRFYRVLEWGRQADEAIGLYGALDRRDHELKRDLTVDALVSRLESAIIREYEKGGTAAGVKGAVDRALDELHREAGAATAQAREAAQRLKDRVSHSAGRDVT